MASYKDKKNTNKTKGATKGKRRAPRKATAGGKRGGGYKSRSKVKGSGGKG